MNKPKVTVVIPVFNEERHLADCIESLLNDSYPRDCLDFAVVDGGSTDFTRDIAQSLQQAKYPFMRLLVNRKRFQSAAFNVAMRATEQTDYFMRADAHAVYPPNFISTTIEIAMAHPEAIIVYNAQAIAATCFQKAVAYAQNAPLGVGNSHYRLGKRSCYVEHGFHGCFPAAFVREAGGYDEAFRTNEDAELSYRLAQLGHAAWLDQRLNVGYLPRATPLALSRQYWSYGRGRAQNILKHKMRLRLRQLAPIVLVGATPPLLGVGVVQPLVLLPLVSYLGFIVAEAGRAAIKQRDPCLLWAILALPIMHYAWGAGFLFHLAAMSRRRPPRLTPTVK